MFAAAGYADVSEGLPDDLIDNLVVSGDEARIGEELQRRLREGAGEVMAQPVVIGDDHDAYMSRFFSTVAIANQAAVPR
jgi:hypothetical protein